MSEVIRPCRLGDRRGPVDHTAIFVVTMTQDEGAAGLHKGVLFGQTLGLVGAELRG